MYLRRNIHEAYISRLHCIGKSAHASFAQVRKSDAMPNPFFFLAE